MINLPTMQIGDRQIGGGAPVYIIAEMSANHHQDLGKALELIRAAHAAGADAIKLQTYTADTLTIDAPQSCFRVGTGTIWEGRTLFDLYSDAFTPWDWHPQLQAAAQDLGLHLFSSPFDATAVDFLEAMDVPTYKVASFEIVDLPLIAHIARTGKPIIISTGMASLGEISEAVATARDNGAAGITLLKCTSAYPAVAAEMNLRTIPHLAEAFDVPTGLSDHTLGIAVPVAAVALGACIVEKHITLSRSDPGPDSAFSLEPGEFKEMVTAIRTTEEALGRVVYTCGERELKSQPFRRSLFIVQDMEAGEQFSTENVRSIRPGHGLAPKYIDEVLGRRATRRLVRGTPLDRSAIG